MKKFGVHEDNLNPIKVAAVDKAHSTLECPVCGAETQQHGHIFLCPVHGSKPFERDAPKK